MQSRCKPEHRTHDRIDRVQNKSRDCVALSHVTRATSLTESHFRSRLIKPLMSYTTKLSDLWRTAPFWSPFGYHGSISIMSHGNRRTVVCISQRGLIRPKKGARATKRIKAGKRVTFNKSCFLMKLKPALSLSFPNTALKHMHICLHHFYSFAHNHAHFIIQHYVMHLHNNRDRRTTMRKEW